MNRALTLILKFAFPRVEAHGLLSFKCYYDISAGHRIRYFSKKNKIGKYFLNSKIFRVHTCTYKGKEKVSLKNTMK